MQDEHVIAALDDASDGVLGRQIQKAPNVSAHLTLHCRRDLPPQSAQPAHRPAADGAADCAQYSAYMQAQNCALEIRT
jgi:hypothetical protein